MATPTDTVTAPDADATAKPDAPEGTVNPDAKSDDEPLGEGGKKALEAERAARKAAEDREKALAKEAEELREYRAKAEGREAEYEAERKARESEAAIRSEINQELIKARAEAALAGKVGDPEYAVWLLRDKLSDVSVEGTKVDVQAITALVNDLIEERPNLAVARDEQRFQGKSDAGPRDADNKSEEQQLQDAIVEATTAGNHTLSIQLKQRLAAVRREPKKG